MFGVTLPGGIYSAGHRLMPGPISHSLDLLVGSLVEVGVISHTRGVQYAVGKHSLKLFFKNSYRKYSLTSRS